MNNTNHITPSYNALIFNLTKNLLLGLFLALLSQIIVEKISNSLMFGLSISLIMSIRTLLHQQLCSLNFSDNEIMIKYGIWPHQKATININEISATKSQQPILHRYLNYGSLSIILTSGKSLLIHNIHQPLNIQYDFVARLDQQSSIPEKNLTTKNYHQSTRLLKILLSILSLMIFTISSLILSTFETYIAIYGFLLVTFCLIFIAIFYIGIQLANTETIIITNKSVLSIKGWADNIRYITYFSQCNKIMIDEYHKILWIHAQNYSRILPTFDGLSIFETAQLIHSYHSGIILSSLFFPIEKPNTP